MAGSILANAHLFKSIAPRTPSRLIDGSEFILDFIARKFITIGLDPADNFNVVIQIITPSRYIQLSPAFLRKAFSLMGYIFSIILGPAYTKIRFLDTENYKLSTVKYRNENMLVIESKTEDGCRILLNRSDLLTLQTLESSIFETVEVKNKIVLPLILQQFEKIVRFLKNKFKQPLSEEDMVIKIRNIEDGTIKSQILGKDEHSFISQIKILAIEQLAVGVIDKNEKDMTYEEKNSEFTPIDLTMPRYIPHQPEDFSQAMIEDENDGPLF